LPLDSPALERSLDRYYAAGLLAMALLVAGFPLYRLNEPARRANARDAIARESVVLGRASFALHCASCHGVDGTGGGIAPTLDAREFLTNTTDAQLMWMIAGGVPGTTMGAYAMDLGGPFTPQEVERVAKFLRSLEPGATGVEGWRSGAKAPVRQPARQPPPARPKETTKPGPTPPEVISLYRTTCGACHGMAGEGTPIGPRLRPTRATLSDDSLRILIERGKKGTAMLPFAVANGGRLTPDAITALVRYLRAKP
jgi:mono/diheme cytochrome c family protein